MNNCLNTFGITAKCIFLLYSRVIISTLFYFQSVVNFINANTTIKTQQQRRQLLLTINALIYDRPYQVHTPSRTDQSEISTLV